MNEEIEDGGQAFPSSGYRYKDDDNDYMVDGDYGMSLRDWFAGQIIMGLCARTDIPIINKNTNAQGQLSTAQRDFSAITNLQSDFFNSDLAKTAYELADAMIKAGNTK